MGQCNACDQGEGTSVEPIPNFLTSEFGGALPSSGRSETYDEKVDTFACKFAALFKELLTADMTDEQFRIAFNKVDRNSDGVWDKMEIKDALRLLGKPDLDGVKLTQSMPEDVLHPETIRNLLSLGISPRNIPANRRPSTRRQQSRIGAVPIIEAIKTSLGLHGSMFVQDASDQDLLQLYRELDVNGDGLLSHGEIEHGMLEMGRERSDVDAAIDALPEGDIDFYTFKEIVQKELQLACVILDYCGWEDLSDLVLRKVFDSMDVANHGVVCKKTLSKSLTNDMAVSAKSIGPLLKGMQEKPLSFEEFKEVVLKGLAHRIKKNLAQRIAIHRSGEIICFSTKGFPHSLEKHLYPLEREEGIPGLVKFVITELPSGEWQIQAVAQEGTGMKARVALKSAWRGLKGDALCKAVRIKGCVSVSRNGCIGVHKTRAGAIAMCAASLQQQEVKSEGE